MEILNSPYITYALIAIILILIAFIVRLEVRMKKLFKGNTVDSVEKTILSTLDDIKRLEQAKTEVEKELQEIKEKIKKNIRTVGTVRFNPFSDVGGKQSFASAFIDSDGNGVVLSSLFSREKVSVFAKPIINLGSEYELSEEEKEAIKKTWDNINGIK